MLEEVGGWSEVVATFQFRPRDGMDRYPERFMVLLIDFDGNEDRLISAKAAIPEQLGDRVFVLGVWSNPEALKADLGTYEHIGSAMADDCRKATNTIWGHEFLRHNASELERLRVQVRSILF